MLWSVHCTKWPVPNRGQRNFRLALHCSKSDSIRRDLCRCKTKQVSMKPIHLNKWHTLLLMLHNKVWHTATSILPRGQMQCDRVRWWLNEFRAFRHYWFWSLRASVQNVRRFTGTNAIIVRKRNLSSQLIINFESVLANGTCYIQ